MKGKERRPEKGSCFISPSTHSSTMKFETAGYSRKLISTRRHIPEYRNVNIHRRKNLGFHSVPTWQKSSNKSWLRRDVPTCTYCLLVHSLFIIVATQQEFHSLMTVILPATCNLHSTRVYGGTEKKHVPDGDTLQNLTTTSQAVSHLFWQPAIIAAGFLEISSTRNSHARTHIQKPVYDVLRGNILRTDHSTSLVT